MSAETKTEKSVTTPASNDNKVVFGPLGKYAAVAVIMVSIIVTTAIMLDKQLGTVEEKIAAMEEEVAASHSDNTTAAIAVEPAIEETVADNTEMKDVKVIEAATDMTASITTAQDVAEVVETAAAESQPVDQAVKQSVKTATITTPASPVDTAQKAAIAETTQFEMVSTKESVQAQREKRIQDNLARIEAYKLEQKQHLAEVYSRIKALESKQLVRYKASQDNQITRLRKQVSQQQNMIESLVLRNKELFELREANMQRNQQHRDQSLNRI